MHKKHIFLRVFSKITLFACVFCAFFISPVFATLPAGYTELEYIESTGTQYIDTGFAPTANYKHTIVFETLSSGTGYLCGTGSAGGRSGNVKLTGNNILDIYNNDSGTSAVGILSYVQLAQGKNTLVLDLRNASKSYVSLNGVNLETTNTNTYITSSLSVTLFSSGGASSVPLRMYESIIEQNGVVIAHFVPAKNSSGVVGMYDTVSGTFFTNAGTGSFVAGPVLPTPENPVEVVSVGDKIIPDGYTELEYIESTIPATEGYIDTGLEYNSTYTYEIEYSKGGLANVFMGARSASSYLAKGNFSLTYNSTTCVYSSTSNASTASNFGDSDFGVRHNVKYQQSTSTLLFDNTNYWLSTWVNDVEIPYNVYLFAFNQGGTPGGSRSVYARIYSYSVKNANGTLIQNFVPAKRNSDNVIGMYDTVSNQFFTNSGTGSFIAGPVAEIKIATTKYVETEFAAAEAKLAITVQTIESVVSRTISQTEQIQVLQDTKQTRPDETCPANMKCLLVQDEDGTPHWYPIIEP